MLNNICKKVSKSEKSIPNLVVKLYCNDDTVEEVLRKNSSRPGTLFNFYSDGLIEGENIFMWK